VSDEGVPMGTNASEAAEGEGSRSRTLGRGIAVLHALAASPDGVTVAGLSTATGLDRAVLYRLLGTLGDEGLVVRDNGSRRYRLGVGLIELGARAARGLEVRRHALPGMRQLLEQVREAVCLAVRDRGDIVVVDRLEPPGRGTRIGYPVGLRHPLSVNAHGRAVLSRLDAAEGEALANHAGADPLTDRARGFAIATDESGGEIVSVAAPILDAVGDGIASVGIVAPASRVQDPALLGPPVRALGREVSRRLGYREEAT